MKHSIKFKAITHRGLLVNKILRIEAPEGTSPIQYLDVIDKTSLMEENDWGCIIDYSFIPKTKRTSNKNKKSNLMIYFEKHFANSEQKQSLLLDFTATFLQMKESLKGLNVEKQFLLILKAMNIGYDASSEAYRKSIEMIKAISDKNIQKELGWDKHPKMLKLQNQHPDIIN
jgi:hypothetical protein